ncbi:hypothetical protein AUK40_04410 [Candidatus Wirthbacteria bacterium CG2_30_54_11]|uniref:Uncharacterized protein n=1 Tax=Candidatus Wirthbacteria bacterium CG2_30_54_11 TaxID=1817892 RepID=A0A1J5IIH8_9BACT|nr:MAG: hypothetical protein AUK40_04410 [Candidatus Wirthbacteria bacterium CG2_30_54_11]
MNDAQMLLIGLESTILTPLFQTMQLDQQAEKAIRMRLNEIILQKMLEKSVAALPEERIEELTVALQGTTGPDEKIQLIRTYLQAFPRAQRAVLDYMKKDLPDFIKEILFAYLEKASPEQKETFFHLSAGK